MILNFNFNIMPISEYKINIDRYYAEQLAIELYKEKVKELNNEELEKLINKELYSYNIL